MTQIRASRTTARNAPCPCGSGKKYKHCCLPSEASSQASPRVAHATPVPSVAPTLSRGRLSAPLPAAPSRLPHRAQALHRAGDPHVAEALYRQVLEQEPANGNAFNLLGVALGEQGMPDRAVESIRQAIRLNGRVADYHRNLGMALRQAAGLPAALAALQEAVRLQPDDGTLHRLLGDVLRDLGDWREAARCYRDAITLRPDDARAMHGLGRALAAQDDQQGAVEQFEAAAAHDPQDFEALNQLAMALLKLNRPAQAERILRRLVESHPQTAAVRLNLIHVLQTLCAWSDLDSHVAVVRTAVHQHAHEQISPFSFLAMETTAAEQLVCA